MSFGRITGRVVLWDGVSSTRGIFLRELGWSGSEGGSWKLALALRPGRHDERGLSPPLFYPPGCCSKRPPGSRVPPRHRPITLCFRPALSLYVCWLLLCFLFFVLEQNRARLREEDSDEEDEENDGESDFTAGSSSEESSDDDSDESEEESDEDSDEEVCCVL